MKHFYVILLLMFLWGCDTDFAPDCIQAAGKTVQISYDLEPFKDIIVWERVKLIVAQGPEQRVVLETGENLLNEIHVRVEDSILKVSDRNSCNFVRDYAVTKIFVFAPNIEEIRNSSGLTVEGRGTIAFRQLTLISEDRDFEGEFHIDGDFNFKDLDVSQLRVYANGLSTFYLKGKTISANFGMYDGDVRIEAGELEIRDLYLYHRSTNKMIVNPQRLIRGVITGIGDVISKNRPPFVEVEERFQGKLIFE